MNILKKLIICIDSENYLETMKVRKKYKSKIVC